jgi:drug/metabolite transporter (DMT)-like permease
MVLLNLPGGLEVEWRAVPLTIWAGLLWAVVLSSFMGWIVWGWVNATWGVARTAPLIYMMPPAAGLVAWWVTGEGYGAIKLIGAAVTLIGVAVAQFARRDDPARSVESTGVVD